MAKYLKLVVALMIVMSPIVSKADFVDETYISGQSFITAIAFSPNGQMYFFEKNTGTVKVVLGPDLVRSQPFFQFEVNNDGERGGLGLTFHPSYPDSPYVYCYVTIPQPVLENVIIRLVDSSGYGINPDTIFRAPITVVYSNHNGGNIHFGPDGKLYATMGENNQPPWAQDTCRVQGKILRFNYDGTIPADNPIYCAPIYAYGLRNSFDFCFHPITGALYASENGPDANDEINKILPGRNYGWPNVQCMSTDPSYQNPLICWTPTIAPTGIVLAWDSQIAEFNGKLLMTDWNTGTLHLLTLSQSGDSILSDEHIFSAGTGLINVKQGPDGCFYLASGDGSIIRFRPSYNAPSPFGLVSPADHAKIVNQNAFFSWENSTDPEGPVNYQFEISTENTFTAPFYTENTSNLISNAVSVDSIFSIAHLVYWRVKAIDGDDHITYGGLPMPSSRQIEILPPGDANASGILNGIDIIFLVNYLKGTGPNPEPLTAADANADCSINGLDVIYLVNYFKGGALPTRGNCAQLGIPVEK
jgi:glucose/arabinose dehydrogenase